MKGVLIFPNSVLPSLQLEIDAVGATVLDRLWMYSSPFLFGTVVVFDLPPTSRWYMRASIV
jgi:hypothetical protein